MLWRWLGLVGVLLASRAGAQAHALTVTREAGAEGCPDAPALLARIEQLRGRPDAGKSARYGVVFGRDTKSFVATIRTGSDPARARVLRDRGQVCAALERATAVTLALLLDSDARASTPRQAPASESQSARPARAIARPAATAVGAVAGERAPLRASVAVGAGGAIGVLRPIAPAFVAEVGLASGRLRAGLAGVFAPAQTHELAPGRVRETLWAGALRGCFAPWLAAHVRLDACSGLYAGSLHAEAHGFSDDAAASRLWLALPLELVLSSTWLPLGWELDASLLWPLRRDDFAVQGAGTAYVSPKLAGLLSIRGYAAWEW
jgi:hypothetical protein